MTFSIMVGDLAFYAATLFFVFQYRWASVYMKAVVLDELPDIPKARKNVERGFIAGFSLICIMLSGLDGFNMYENNKCFAEKVGCLDWCQRAFRNEV